ncbi:LPXTG cell wall anchor domain-containing protein [Balamuthia mandrillaris]
MGEALLVELQRRRRKPLFHPDHPGPFFLKHLASHSAFSVPPKLAAKLERERQRYGPHFPPPTTSQPLHDPEDQVIDLSDLIARFSTFKPPTPPSLDNIPRLAPLLSSSPAALSSPSSSSTTTPKNVRTVRPSFIPLSPASFLANVPASPSAATFLPSSKVKVEKSSPTASFSALHLSSLQPSSAATTTTTRAIPLRLPLPPLPVKHIARRTTTSTGQKRQRETTNNSTETGTSNGQESFEQTTEPSPKKKQKERHDKLKQTTSNKTQATSSRMVSLKEEAKKKSSKQKQQLPHEEEDSDDSSLDKPDTEGAEDKRRKRRRRLASQIERKFPCQFARCNKAYGTQGALDQHVRKKHPNMSSLRGPFQVPLPPSLPLSALSLLAPNMQANTTAPLLAPRPSTVSLSLLQQNLTALFLQGLTATSSSSSSSLSPSSLPSSSSSPSTSTDASTSSPTLSTISSASSPSPSSSSLSSSDSFSSSLLPPSTISSSSAPSTSPTPTASSPLNSSSYSASSTTVNSPQTEQTALTDAALLQPKDPPPRSAATKKLPIPCKQSSLGPAAVPPEK